VRLVRWGVEYDVAGRNFDELTSGQRDAVIAAHPRHDFEEGVIEAFAGGVRDKPETAFAPFQMDVLEATVPGYVRPNFCETVRRSRFSS
jgi:hypothetical protein